MHSACILSSLEQRCCGRDRDTGTNEEGFRNIEGSNSVRKNIQHRRIKLTGYILRLESVIISSGNLTTNREAEEDHAFSSVVSCKHYVDKERKAENRASLLD